MFGNKKRLVDQLQKQGGTVAWATVLEADDQWQSASGTGAYPSHVTDHVKVTVRVEPDGGEPFEQTFHQAFPGLTPHRECTCKVIYDPQDHAKIAVLDGSIAPPGFSHEKAERSAARRAEAIEAVRSGHLTEYIEKQKAEAMQLAAAGGARIVIDGQPLVLGGAGQAPAPAPSEQSDPADQLAKLAELHSKGVLTDAEFAAAKAKVLASM
jgi:Short C-terminal domain